MSRKNRSTKTLLRTFSRYSNISATIPMERNETFVVKNGLGIGVERWEVTSVGHDDQKKRFFIADITELHPFYND